MELISAPDGQPVTAKVKPTILIDSSDKDHSAGNLHPVVPCKGCSGLLTPLSGSRDQLDKYTAGIEVSNACRRFYVTRSQTMDQLRLKLDEKATPGGTPFPKLESAINMLKRELVAMVDQDLVLMKQLLTLNEKIEELKWQRKMNGYNPTASCATSASSAAHLLDDSADLFGGSACTLGELDTMPGEHEHEHDGESCLPSKYPTLSTLSLLPDCQTELYSTQDSLDRLAVSPDALANSRSTSDLGSSQELSNSSVTDLRKLAAISPACRAHCAEDGHRQTPTRQCSATSRTMPCRTVTQPAVNDQESTRSLGRVSAAKLVCTDELASSGKQHSLDSGFQEHDGGHSPEIIL